MKVSQFVPVPVIVGVIAFFFMIASAKFNFLAWVSFITWGAYFLSGVTTKSAIRETIAFTLGILTGMAIVVVATSLTPTLGSYAFPVVVGVAAFIIVMLELVPWVDMAPMYFLAAAAFFAAGAKPDVPTFMSVWTSGMVGILLGVVVAYLRRQVFKLEGVKDPLKK